jgi:hypothetical protein
VTDDKQKMNGCAITLVIVLIPFVIAIGVTALWILIEFGQWIGRQ